MKRRGLAVLLAAVLGASMLAGCGNSEDGSSGGKKKVRLMVWSPSEDQSKDSGEWLQTTCEKFADEHPEWDITFVYGVADEATAAGQVAQDPEASADVFMYANDTLTTMTDANALVKFGGKYREEIERTNTEEVISSLTKNGELYGVPFTTNTWFMYYDKSVFDEEDVKALLHENLHRLLMTPPMVFIFALTILPLIFMICMAFTNYSKIDNHLMLFEWVGLDNFRALFDSNSILGSTFWSVLAWTIVWAFFATFSNYIFGMILSIVINRKETRAKGFWRFCFVLSCAVPMFVSLLIMRTMLQPEGAVNVLLRNLGLIAQDASLPFFTDPMWARVTVIVINIWVGVPYTLLQLTGVLQNIPGELYEAAKVDGANAVQIFFKITLPYMLYVTTPYLITTFTGNVNNFNIIYLLSGGDPVTDLSSTAGSTDLLVTWLYKLTIDKQYYNIGAVIGILTFIILAIAALLTYRNSKSYKEEGGF